VPAATDRNEINMATSGKINMVGVLKVTRFLSDLTATPSIFGSRRMRT